MGIMNLDRIFSPKSVALVGATERPGGIGDALMKNLLEGRERRAIFPVNPNHKNIHGLKSFASLSDIGEPVELVLIAVPIAGVPEVVRECVRVGASGCVIFSAGGKEIGEQGRHIEARIREAAKGSALRIVGPNCMGLMAPGSLLNASFANQSPRAGNLAFVSQSGAICSAILDWSLKEGIGFSHFVSVGSMLDVDFGDFVDYLGNLGQVKSILLYIESLTQVRKFMSAARAVSRVKPIIVLKAGRSAAGSKAAASHTGAMTGEDTVYDAAFERAGILRVDTIQDLFDVAEPAAKVPRPKGSRLAVITNAGGPGVMAADALASFGVEPAELNDRTMGELDEVLPAYWSRRNPVDVLGDATSERYRRALDICIRAEDVDGILAILAPQAMTDPTEVARAVKESAQNISRPVFACWMGGRCVEPSMELLNEGQVPTYSTPERAVKAFMLMVEYNRKMEMLQQIPPGPAGPFPREQTRARRVVDEALRSGRRFLTEVESKKLLGAYGIPVNRTEQAESGDEAVRIGAQMGYPLAMKLNSPDISHKSDVGGVRLNLGSEDDVRAAHREILANARRHDPQARILGVTLQSMIQKGEYEVLLGAKRDEDFGPVIVFGLGGILTEVLKDTAVALPPLNRLLVRRLIEKTRVARLLKGFRNLPPADMGAMEEMILRLSDLLIDFPEISELDMNPVLIFEGKPCAVDARVILEPTEVVSPLHLVVSPYPSQQEYEVTTSEGMPIFLRPIKPEDAPLLVELFETLSKTSIYLRFMGYMESLPQKMLARFTQIDYDREIALVALKTIEGEERMLGVARVIAGAEKDGAEFAVLVGDPWQGKGVGAELLQKCLKSAKKLGIRHVWGTVLQENSRMLELGRKLGFSTQLVPGTHEYELNIDLDRAEFD